MDAMTLRGPLLALSILGLASGCAGHDDKEGNAPTPATTTPPSEPGPGPEPATVDVKVSVASVQLQDDCPSAKPAKPVAPAEPEASASKPAMQQKAVPGDVARGASAEMAKGFAPMCTQSRVQLSIESDSDAAQAFAVVAVRLKKADGGDLLSTMSPREPTLWEDSKYNPWDESIAAGASIKVGYALGDPDWGKVGKALGGDTWAPMYIVEIDVEIGGQVQTVASPKVPRDEPENIVT